MDSDHYDEPSEYLRDYARAYAALKKMRALFRLPPAGGRCDDMPAMINADYEDEIIVALNAADAVLGRERIRHD